MAADYPETTDLQAFVPSGFTLPSENIQQAALNAAIDEWHRRTGFTPFMAAEEEVTLSFTPAYERRGVIDFKGGFAAVPVVTYSDTELVLYADYELMPENAVERKRPYTYLRFLGNNPWGYGPLLTSSEDTRITVTGPFGFCPYGELPDDVWLAILAKAAANLSTNVTGGSTNSGIVAKQEGTTRIEYAQGGPYRTEVKEWNSLFETTLRTPGYKRTAVA